MKQLDLEQLISAIDQDADLYDVIQDLVYMFDPATASQEATETNDAFKYALMVVNQRAR